MMVRAIVTMFHLTLELGGSLATLMVMTPDDTPCSVEEYMAMRTEMVLRARMTTHNTVYTLHLYTPPVDSTNGHSCIIPRRRRAECDGNSQACYSYLCGRSIFSACEY